MAVGDGTPGPGRPKGSVNEKTKELLEWGSQVLSDDVWREGAKQRMAKGEAPHLETYLLHRIHGKPKEKIEIESSLPLFALPAGAMVQVMRPIEPDEADGVPDALDGVKS